MTRGQQLLFHITWPFDATNKKGRCRRIVGLSIRASKDVQFTNGNLHICHVARLTAISRVDLFARFSFFIFQSGPKIHFQRLFRYGSRERRGKRSVECYAMDRVALFEDNCCPGLLCRARVKCTIYPSRFSITEISAVNINTSIREHAPKNSSLGNFKHSLS